MDIGVVLQTTPPSARVIDLAKRAETYGFSHVWTFDSHLLWEEPFPIYTADPLRDPHRHRRAPWSPTRSHGTGPSPPALFATLNEMFGNRTVIGIGRGDSAVRVINGRPSTLAAAGRGRRRDPRARQRAGGRATGARPCGCRGRRKSRVEVWMAGYGPKALKLIGEVGDGFILQLADPDIAAWTIGAVRRAAEEAGRDPARSRSVSQRRPTSARTSRTRATSAGGSAGWSATTSPTSSLATVRTSEVPAALTDYIKEREGYDYNEHGQAGNVHTAFVPDEIVDRFCVLGPVAEHVRRLEELRALGVDQFAVYLQHDAKDETLQAYGEKILPAIAERVAAKS